MEKYVKWGVCLLCPVFRWFGSKEFSVFLSFFVLFFFSAHSYKRGVGVVIMVYYDLCTGLSVDLEKGFFFQLSSLLLPH